jgi:putative sterol carrier protein
MSDAPLYWSDAYTEAFVAKLREDPGFQKASRKFDAKIALRCFDTSEGQDVIATYTIRRGSVERERWAETAPSQAIRNAPFDKNELMARMTAPYRIWCKLDRGEMNVVQALMSPDYVLEGPKHKVMFNIGVFNAMSATASSLPKRYE